MTSYTQTPAQQETFLQRQRRLQSQQQAATGSPVSPDGRVTLQSQPTAQYQQPSTQPQQAPTSGTAPSSAPQQWRTPTNKTVTGALQATNLGNAPYSTYQARQFQTPIPQQSALPNSYAGSEFTQFQAPVDPAGQETQGLQSALMNAILRNPQTMNPTALAQMKEQNKEAALLAQQQAAQRFAQNASARGVGPGGYAQALQRDLSNEASNRIITGNRDLDLAALDRNRQDELNALQAAEGVMSGQSGRAIGQYQATLAGEQAQADDARFVSNDALQRALQGFDSNMRSAQLGLQAEGMGADEAFRQYQSQFGAEQAAQERALQQFGVNQGAFTTNLQAELGRGELSLDQQRLAEQARQFRASQAQQASQFNQNMGFNYAGMQNQQNSDLMNYLARIYGF